MAAQAVFRGAVDDGGRLKLDDRPRLTAHLQGLAGKPVELVVRKPKSKRSLDQNSYWWAEPVPRLADYCGNTPAQMHYALLGECFGYQDGPLGQPVPVKPSSSDLSVDEFKQLIDWVLVWSPSELGVALMSPEEWSLTQ